jgi:hypothetical protein
MRGELTIFQRKMFAGIFDAGRAGAEIYSQRYALIFPISTRLEESPLPLSPSHHIPHYGFTR